MQESFNTVLDSSTNEIIVKKSRFIATISPVQTETEAIEFIEQIKKRYWDASHNCSAYIIGAKQPLMRCSDDGEPSKTAGKPMLDILINHELSNLAVVVTRYFGGTLLGTGGLVKAYQSAVLEVLNQCTIIKKELGIQLSISTDYNYIGKIQYYIGQDAIPILASNYTDIVEITVLMLPVKKQTFFQKITELTNGSAIMEEKKQVYFTILNHEIHLFD